MKKPFYEPRKNNDSPEQLAALQRARRGGIKGNRSSDSPLESLKGKESIIRRLHDLGHSGVHIFCNILGLSRTYYYANRKTIHALFPNFEFLTNQSKTRLAVRKHKARVIQMTKEGVSLDIIAKEIGVRHSSLYAFFLKYPEEFTPDEE